MLTTDAVGGVWQYSIDLAEALQPLGYETTLAVLGPPPSSAQRARAGKLRLIETGLDLEWLASGPGAVLVTQRELATLAGDLRADAVQLHSPALIGANRFPCPVVAMLHSCVATWWTAVRGGPMPADFAWRTDLVRQGLARATMGVAPSAAFAQAAMLHYGAAPQVVYNGRALVARPSPMQDFVFTAGRLWDEAKNVRQLARAAAGIPVPFKAAGPVRSPQGDVTGFDTLHLLGTLDEAALARALGARPVFASAALYEPFGLSVLEAASAGCALVLSDIPTFRELWGGAAVFVAPDDAKGFCAAITSLIEDRAKRVAMGEVARDRARRYSPAAMAQGMATLHARAQERNAA
ncbi:glycosyltransferase family 4 protein [Sphingobium yanoikuyae]|uniref:glycosyltransferase family 4 protein n=1 Tax=Sphingobium yanoikuyae TaxID=13690 RepID=UPI0022DE0437|nr:glycosyltransferase family 4 protein [Sphingobium yanoikuyae]WBQ19420.1 glycosyltransferase family 4 protein [Sphingobium yanoikuyae]